MKTNLKATVALFAGLGFMSFAAIFMKSAQAPGIVTAFYRMAIASVVLAIPFLISITRKSRISSKGILFASLAGICFGLDMSLWSTGVVLSNATIPTLTANLAPIWVGFGTILIFKKPQKIGFWLGILVAILGMIVLIHRDWNADSNIVGGALLGVGAGIFYGIFYLFSEPGRKALDTLQFLFISTFSSALLLAVLVAILGYNFTGYDKDTYLIFIGIGVGVQVCGWFLINYSQGFLPATTVAPTLLGQPVLTFVWAALLLQEHLTVWHISGGIVIVIGIYLVHYSRTR